MDITNFFDLLPPFITIPSTAFLMGTPERELSALAKAYGGTRESYREESPQHTLVLPAFEIAQVPVTNALYAAYVAEAEVPAPAYWRGPQPPAELRDHPVVEVSWEEAGQFCSWLTARTKNKEQRTESKQQRTKNKEQRAESKQQTAKNNGSHRPWFSALRSALSPQPSALSPQPSALSYRLPSEAEWELAARGTQGWAFPWGQDWDNTRANTSSGGPATTTPAGLYPQGASPFGCLDMCGNVWEWTSSLDARYPYAAHDGREQPSTAGRRILRGGCFANPHGYARCACRFRLGPGVRNAFLGFRLARV
ncbi:MAG: formylglycine-generating enzyme family protein [Roseiflexaceae bacterium]|nr:formylglycine-generating enzyme family protein [Roseiflexaceae bacterium]